MKKGISLLGVAALAIANFQLLAQEATDAAAETTGSEDGGGFIYTLKKFFIDGGPEFMTPILICLVLGLAFVIERIIYLNSVDKNSSQVLNSIEEAFQQGGFSEAKDVARNTPGPIASIAYQALERKEDGQKYEEIENSVVNYGGVEVGKLERNMPWISLFITIAPMLGFMGTVIGMVLAFSDIETSGTVNPTDMASNIKVALLTTLFGLIVAIILQIFYNYITTKIDSIVNSMEDSSISILDFVAKR